MFIYIIFNNYLVNFVNFLYQVFDFIFLKQNERARLGFVQNSYVLIINSRKAGIGEKAFVYLGFAVPINACNSALSLVKFADGNHTV